MSTKDVEDAHRPSMPESRPLNPLSCFIVGTESLVIQCAEILLQRGHQICGIISSESSIARWAEEKGITWVAPGPDLAAVLNQHRFDYLFSIANLSVIPNEILSLARKGAINFHDGPLPKYAGLHATSWALINQESTYGITWHSMSDTVDKGDILKQRAIAIAPGETAFTLNAKCYEAAIESFAELVDGLAVDRVTFLKQDLAERTYFGRYKRPDAAGVVSWSQTAEQISALSRALDFGSYANPLGLPKIITEEEIFVLPEIEVRGAVAQAAPGTVVAIDSDTLTLATSSKEVVVRTLLTLTNEPVPVADFVKRCRVVQGNRLPELDGETAVRLTALDEATCRHEEFWRKRLGALAPLEIPYANRSLIHHAAVQYATMPMSVPAEVESLLAEGHGAPNRSRSDCLVAAFAVYLAHVSGNYTFDLGFGDLALRRALAGFERFFAANVPLRVEIDPSGSFDAALDVIQTELALVRKRQSYARDTILRYPELSPLRDRDDGSLLPVVVEQVECLDDHAPLPGSELTLLVSEDGKECRWVHDTTVLQSESVMNMQRQFATFLRNIAADRNRSVGRTPLLAETEVHQLLIEWNDTRVDYPRHLCVHQLIEAQVERTPDIVAVICEDQQITYDQLNRRANRLARHLRELGVRAETRVGIYMERSIDMMVGLLGVLKAGGAYVPLDPTYPKERIAFMVRDAQMPVLLTQARLVKELPPHQARVVSIDADWEAIAAASDENVFGGAAPENLGYVMYTSGSTGKPKGVMVCHRNIVNFFTGMDERIRHEPPGVWLAVTSLSFDISVLELFWTLARGFRVIVYADKTRGQVAAEPASSLGTKSIAFSLFYFASDESERGVTDKYRLLLEGAKFADTHGFAAVWTPERHFHAFGGLYPNPSVAGAAIAAITERVGIRAGSCVLPLHNPIRVAEEWSLVDNISKGRVGISFASGWQPNDFVLKPENHAQSKAIMFRDIEVVRKLWRGEAVDFPGPSGKDVAVRTLPRPVQPKLPIWVTAAGTPETFRMAGERGFNVLTHLLGQSVEEVSEKMAIYRKAWVDGGHPGQGHVTLMLHTFVGDDVDEVREVVRKPMTDYLRSSVGLIKEAAWNFPTFKQRAGATGKNPLEIFETEAISPEDLEELLNFAFERYFETSGLFGTPGTCLRMVDRLKAMGVDEIACLIDFGISSETALAHLTHLKTLKELATSPMGAEDYSIPGLIRRHRATHMQCTPSMAGMLAMSEEGRDALGTLQTFMVGGEAFPVTLAAELQRLIPGDIINMYGPTETTVWSSTCKVRHTNGAVPIGTPIANTEMYILDANLQPVPVGVPGELYIGGDGVVRGYLGRPELTAERFVAHPFRSESQARVYRTGDLARYRPDGNIEFLGRIDHQVKIRGYRIELGEIETVLAQHPGVQKAVVVARSAESLLEKRLVAYVVPHRGHSLTGTELQDFLKEKLPDYMVPSVIAFLTALPLTPNGKVDRGALPAPDPGRRALEDAFVAPRTPVEEVLARIWGGALGLERVGVHDNFFALGGHSLLAARVISEVRGAFQVALPLHSLFVRPTVMGLSEALIAAEAKPGQTEKVARVLQRIEGMSADEVGQMLEQRKGRKGAL